MRIPFRHAVHQHRVVRSFLSAAIAKPTRAKGVGPVEKRLTYEAPPLPDRLINDYVRHVGGTGYKRTVPPHLAPQWFFPLTSRLLQGLPYPPREMLNGGCRFEIAGDLPRGEAFSIEAERVAVEESDARVLIKQRAVTHTKAQREVLVAHFTIVFPKKKQKRKRAKRKTVPDDTRQIEQLSVPERAGREFALLTGDFNPIHTVPPIARAMGFPNVINHGFSTLARTYEAVRRQVYRGRPRPFSMFEARFTKPLVLPARTGIFLAPSPTDDDDRRVFVGHSIGAPMVLDGRFRPRTRHDD